MRETLFYSLLSFLIFFIQRTKSDPDLSRSNFRGELSISPERFHETTAPEDLSNQFPKLMDVRRLRRTNCVYKFTAYAEIDQSHAGFSARSSADAFHSC